MKIALGFWVLFFFVYTTGIFFISDYFILAMLGIFNIFLVIVTQGNIFRLVKILLLFMPFLLITAALNFFLADLDAALLISARFLLACSFTYVFISYTGAIKFARGLEALLLPLRIFRIPTKRASLIIAIAITFIPVFIRESRHMREAMNARGLRKPKIALSLRILTYQILYRAAALGETLNAKGYM